MSMEELINNPLFLLLIFLVMILAVLTDLYNRKIPNVLIIFGLTSGLFVQIFYLQGTGLKVWAIGAVLGFCCFFPFYYFRGMAAGDVKLMMVVGGFLGFPLVITAALYSFVAGGLMALVIVLVKRKFKKLIDNLYKILIPLYIKLTSGVDINDATIKPESIGRMPYALAIAAGTLSTLYLNAY